MKKIIFVLGLVSLFNSCGKPGVTPQTMEDVIVGKKWWNTSDEEGMLLDEDGSFYYLNVCEPESLIGKWILEEDFIKVRFYVNSIEYTMLVAELTSYTATELKVKAETTDTNIVANYVFTTQFEETYGCTVIGMSNYSPDAICDDGSCDDIEDVYVNIHIDLSLPEYNNLQIAGNSIFIEGGVKGIIIYHGVGNDYEVYDRNCSYEPSLTCSYIDSINSGIAYCGCCPSAFLLSNEASVLNSPALFSLKEYHWTLSGSQLRIYN